MEEHTNKKNPSVLDQWRQRKKASASNTGIPKRPETEPLIPSSGQKRLWLLQELYPENPFYQYGHLYKINGSFDQSLFIRSLQLVIDRHEILRTNFTKKEDQGIINISKNELKTTTLDLSNSPPENKYQKAIDLAQAEAQQLFDLEKDLLIRVGFIKLSGTETWVILSIHHIIGDRLSLQIINDELFNNYQQLEKKASANNEAPSLQYSDYSHWKNQQATSPKVLNYWKEKLSGDLPILNIPSDFNRPIKSTFSGQTLKKTIDKKLALQLRTLAKESETTLYNLILAAFKVVLFRQTNQSDILIGSPFSNRDKVSLEKIIGFFNETLVLRSKVHANQSFADFLQALKQTSQEAFKYKDIPFDTLVKEIQPERRGSANPIFQVMYLYNKSLESNYEHLPFSFQEEVIDLGVSKFDLTLFVNDLGETFECAFEFSLDLFKPATIERIFQQLNLILQAVVENPDSIISKLPVLTPAEHQQIIIDWNKNAVEFPAYHSIHHLIKEVTETAPDTIAAVFQDNQITYRELEKKASILAEEILSKTDLPNPIIGLYVHRGIEMIIGILGILKAGAAYLPLDPDYPEERIRFMLEDSKAPLLLTTQALKDNINSLELDVLTFESLPNESGQSISFPVENLDDLAYVIYTSGSTGKPKGVPISHRNLLHSTQARFSFYPKQPGSFLLLSSFSFDSSVVGIFWTLCSGGKIVLPPKRIEQDVSQMASLISKEKVTHTLMLPSLYAAILNLMAVEDLSSLQNVMVAGEACPFSLIEKHYQKLPSVELYNEYGPTEASVWCIAHKITLEDKAYVPIGKAIPNTSVYILDTHLQAVPVGFSGELYIGGPGLSKGYLNQPALTAEKFLNHPFKKEEKIYKTGDLARFNQDGNIEFLGRVDQQIKIRGFRVELDEIQNAILDYEGIEESVVAVFSESESSPKQLIAYINHIEALEVEHLKAYLAKRLPDYMVPSIFIPLDEFPRLPNGKINRKKLPDLVKNKTSLSADFSPPISPLEIIIAGIWEAVLNIKGIGIHDNFFALGGDSILSIQIVSKIKDEGIQIAPSQLFEHQTIASLAKSIPSTQLVETNKKEIGVNNIQQYPLSYLQKAFLFNSANKAQDQGRLQLEFVLEGLIDFPKFKEAWEKSSTRHDAMRLYIGQDENQNPIQLVDENCMLKWEHFDWKNKSEEEYNLALEQLKESDKNKNINLKAAPISNMYLVQLSAEKHLLFWSCHHIFLDGWSCGIILKDALNYYSALENGTTLNLTPIPNFLTYLDWKEESSNLEASTFWSDKLADFNTPLLFKSNEKKLAQANQFEDGYLKLSDIESQALRSFSSDNNIAPSSLFQAFWAMVISQLFRKKDVVFGLTVSGRFSNFPDLNLMSGLFMNVVPNRYKLEDQTNFIEWLQSLQKGQGQLSKFEDSTLNEIKPWINFPIHQELFDSLFVYGNFLKDGLKVGPLSVVDFQGGYSSNYPLTIRVNPVEAIEFNWRYDLSKIDASLFNWIKDSFHSLCKEVLKANTSTNLGTILNLIQPYKNTIEINNEQELSTDSLKENRTIIPPRNEFEIQLVSIWMKLFNGQEISIHDNFFDLGGRSLMAIQLFAEIESNLGKILPPTTLFKHPTVASIALLLDDKNKGKADNEVIVPLRSDGHKNPLFCLHGGGAHVFFYQGLAKYLPDDQPVYSIQPPGLQGETPFHKSIEEMASHYIEEIKKVNPSGPFNILGTCFSNSVAIEMANQLKQQGKEIENLFIIDSAPVHLFGDSEDGKSQTMNRFFDMLKRGDYYRIFGKISRRFSAKKENEQQDKKTETAAAKNLRLTIDSLNNMYASYNWKPYEGKIHFIRSSEFHNRPDKKYHLIQWNKLTNKNIEIHVVDGHHISLFEEPEVMGLSNKINQCIQKNT